MLKINFNVCLDISMCYGQDTSVCLHRNFFFYLYFGVSVSWCVIEQLLILWVEEFQQLSVLLDLCLYIISCYLPSIKSPIASPKNQVYA